MRRASLHTLVSLHSRSLSARWKVVSAVDPGKGMLASLAGETHDFKVITTGSKLVDPFCLWHSDEHEAGSVLKFEPRALPAISFGHATWTGNRHEAMPLISLFNNFRLFHSNPMYLIASACVSQCFSLSFL